MSSIGFITSNTDSASIRNFSSQDIENKLENIDEKLKDLPTILDKDTLAKLRDGEYEITLQEYTDMTTYRTKMNALYGNSSASRFPNALNNLLGNPSDEEVSAKDFMDKLKEQGVENKSALKIYNAIKSYNLINSFTKSCVNAWV